MDLTCSDSTKFPDPIDKGKKREGVSADDIWASWYSRDYVALARRFAAGGGSHVA